MEKPLPFVGSLYSEKNQTFGPSITSSDYILTELKMETNILTLQVSLQHLDYEVFSMEEFTHIVVGIVFEVKSNDLQSTGCMNWCHVNEERVKNVELNLASEERSVNVVSCGIIPKLLFLQIAMKNMSETKLNQIDKEVMDQFFNISFEKFIKELHFIQTSKYLSKCDYQTITDIETVCIKTKEISVNKIDKLFKQLTAADWSKNMLQFMKVISNFEDFLKMKNVICQSFKENVVQRAKLCRSLGKKDIKYFVSSDFYDFKTECNKYCDLYLLMFCKEFVDKDKKQFDYVEEEFLGLKKTHQNSVFMFVDIDLLNEKLPFTPSETVICQLRNGRFLSYNVLINETNAGNDSNVVDHTNSLSNKVMDSTTGGAKFKDEIEIDVGKNYVLFSKSNIRDLEAISKWSHLCIPCPGLPCSQEAVLWYCKFCNKNLCFSFDSYIFCDCGRINLTKCKFVCTTNSEDTHTTDEVFLINNLKPTESLNLIIFGQNDEDINIWRNNFYYYLSSFFDETGDKLTLQQLQNLTSNKKTKTDQKKPILCIFNSVLKVYSLFSIPGVCPNLTIPEPNNGQIILESLERKIKYVHGICIIINAVDIRNKLKFQYYIEEILTYFHEDALKNILFCVASSEDDKESTKLALEEVLKKIKVRKINNGGIYFIENNAMDEVKSYTLSDTEIPESVLNEWRTVESEIKRLIEYISVTKSHDISLSVALMKHRIKLYTCDGPFNFTDSIIPYHSLMFNYLNFLIQRTSDCKHKKDLEEKLATHQKMVKKYKHWVGY